MEGEGPAGRGGGVGGGERQVGHDGGGGGDEEEGESYCHGAWAARSSSSFSASLIHHLDRVDGAYPMGQSGETHPHTYVQTTTAVGEMMACEAIHRRASERAGSTYITVAMYGAHRSARGQDGM